ncbi:MAG: hypothetical protein WB784_06425 [Rhodanobacteraceae bacterium]
MSERSLFRLYRRWTACPQTADVAVLDADALVRLIETGLPAGERAVVAHALSRSSSHSGLLHVLRDLRGDSEHLAEQVAGDRAMVHPPRGRAIRRTAGARRLTRRYRIVGGFAALAACLIAVVGVWSMHVSSLRDSSPGSLIVHDAHRADRIFTSKDEIFNAEMGHAVASESSKQRSPDHVFRSGFTGT